MVMILEQLLEVRVELIRPKTMVPHRPTYLRPSTSAIAHRGPITIVIVLLAELLELIRQKTTVPPRPTYLRPNTCTIVAHCPTPILLLSLN
jgi:hypothetical protein